MYRKRRQKRKGAGHTEFRPAEKFSRRPVFRYLAAKAAISAAAAAQDQKDPDQITASAAASTATAAAAVIMSETAVSTAAQDQDQPDYVASAAVSSCCASAPASTVTSAVCCCHIAHVCSSVLKFVYSASYDPLLAHVSSILENLKSFYW